MSFFDKAMNVANDAHRNYDKGYERAEKMTDSQIRNKISSTSNTFQKAGMMQAYKDRKESE